MRRNKYGNRRVAGYASAREYRRSVELKLLEKAGKVSELREQVPFVLSASNGKPVCKYIADFVYLENGKSVVEDVKGFETPVFKLKWKWMKVEYGNEFEWRITK